MPALPQLRVDSLAEHVFDGARHAVLPHRACAAQRSSSRSTRPAVQIVPSSPIAVR